MGDMRGHKNVKSYETEDPENDTLSGGTSLKYMEYPLPLAPSPRALLQRRRAP